MTAPLDEAPDAAADRAPDAAPDEAPDGKPDRSPGQALLDQMGGVSGLIYSGLPVAVLVPVNTAFGLVPAICAALGVAVAFFRWRQTDPRLAPSRAWDLLLAASIAGLVTVGLWTLWEKLAQAL